MFIGTGHSTNSRSKVAIIIGIVVSVAVLLVTIIIVTTVSVYLRRKARTPTPHDVTNSTANKAKDVDKSDSPDHHEMVEQQSQPISSDKFQDFEGFR